MGLQTQTHLFVNVRFEQAVNMVAITNAHSDLIHDAELDYYGKRLATCSSDKTVKIFEVEGDNHKLLETLKGHDGPVWQVSWAHPKFGVILASASYDGRVIIWREENGTWKSIAQHAVHQASVNAVSFGPQEFGALLLCASSDGKVSLVEFKDDGKPQPTIFSAHPIGCNAVSWAPILVKSGPPVKRFATGGCDNMVKIWKNDANTNTYLEEAVLAGHTDWVRDLAWSPSVLSKSYVASASQDRTVIVWTQEAGGGEWQKKLLTEERFPDVVWRVSWSLSGNVLAVSGGDNRVSLWKENLKGDWESAGLVEE